MNQPRDEWWTVETSRDGSYWDVSSLGPRTVYDDRAEALAWARKLRTIIHDRVRLHHAVHEYEELP